MLTNYLLVARRNLVKNSGFSLINIAGLAIGMAVTLLIALWVHDELSYDKYHSTYNRVGQVMTTQTFNNETGTDASIVVPLGNALRTQYGSIFQNVALSSWNQPHILSFGDKKLSQTGMWAEADLPKILGLDIRGEVSALTNPGSVLLASSVARSMFGNDDPVGKIIRVDNKADMQVGGVFDDLPANTTLTETKLLLAWENPANKLSKQTDQWTNHGSQLFVRLHARATFDKASSSIKDLLKPHVTEWTEELQVHPMSQWHLYNEFENGKAAGGRIGYIYLFGTIGFFVLLLACINFMNLSTARGSKRAREIGVRKAVGSLRHQLIGQFLSESVLMAILSLLVAMLIAYFSLPLFNDISGKQLYLPVSTPLFWMLVTAFTFMTGLIAGSYPAFYLSGFNTINILKGSFRVGKFAVIPRKVLVVLQFTISIALIIGTVIIYQQVQFSKQRPVGYSREGLITIDMNTPDLYKSYNALRGDLLQTGKIANMAEANSTITEIWSSNTGLEWSGKDPADNPLFGTIAVTHDYGNTIGWQLVAGRDFSRNHPADSGAFILNESAVKLTGFKDPVGKTIHWNGKDRVITGIVKDMVMESPYEPAQPSIFHLQYGWVNKILLRIKPGVPVRDGLTAAENIFKKHNPSSPFEYHFVDDAYARKFAIEERMGQLAGIFGALAIFISCLGLFGLASFMAEQRSKEISIRKVLGASTTTIWRTLTRDFVGLVFIALLISIPLSYYFMHSWLQQYTFRIGLAWWIFAGAGMAALLITLLTVSYQAARASFVNPLKSLRSE